MTLFRALLANPRTALILGALTLVFASSPTLANETSHEDVRAGLYMPLGFGGQYVPQSWGLDVHIGLGIRIFVVGIGAEAHYIYSWGPIAGITPGNTRE